jgi:hypothetical protein
MRAWRVSAAFAAALVLALSVPVAGDSRCAATPGLEGTWLVKVVYHYGSLGLPDDHLQYVNQFGRDGRAVIYLPHNPDDKPYAEVRSACAGEWKPRGPRTYDVTLYCLWSTSWEGAPAPPVPDRIRMKVVLDKKGRMWQATPFYYDLWVEDHYEAWDTWGEMDGKRLGIAPLP